MVEAIDRRKPLIEVVSLASTQRGRRVQLLEILKRNPDVIIYGGVNDPYLRVHHRQPNPRIWGEPNRNTA